MSVLTLNRSRHESFLADHRKDPYTGELFKAGDKIVICAKCKTAYFESSWKVKGECFVNPKLCNSNETLEEIPYEKTLTILNGKTKVVVEEKKTFLLSKQLLFGSFIVSVIIIGIGVLLFSQTPSNNQSIHTNITEDEILGSYSGRITTEEDTISTYLTISPSTFSDSLKLNFKTVTHSFSFNGFFLSQGNATKINASVEFNAYVKNNFLYLTGESKIKNNSIWEFSKHLSQ